jgi:hypothetical protein
MSAGLPSDGQLLSSPTPADASAPSPLGPSL